MMGSLTLAGLSFFMTLAHAAPPAQAVTAEDEVWSDTISISHAGPSQPAPNPTPSPEATPAAAAGAPTEVPIKLPKPPKKNLRLAPTSVFLTGKPFGTTALAGLGLNAAYEFIITPSFFVGLQLAARYYPAQMWLGQLGYGVTLRHAFLPTDWMFRPYLQYGLLMQMTWVQGQPGSGMSHDTHLGIGVDSKWLNIPLFLQVSYDISRLRYFGNTEENVDRFEIQLGWQYAW